MRLFGSFVFSVLMATGFLVTMLSASCSPESKLDVVLDVPKDIDELNPARKDVLKYLRVTAQYSDGVPETRAADFDPTKPFPLGSFPFGTIRRVEVRGYGADGSMIAYGERNVDSYLGESGLSVTVPFRFMLVYMPSVATGLRMDVTDPFDGINLTTDQEVPTISLNISGSPQSMLLPKDQSGVTAVAISPSGEYGVAAISRQADLESYLSSGTPSSTSTQWLVLFSTKDHVVYSPAYSVQTSAYPIDRIVFSEDGRYVAFSTVANPDTRISQVGIFSAEQLIARRSLSPATLSPVVVQAITIQGMGVVRDVIVHDDQLVVLGNDRDFVNDGSSDVPFFGTAEPAQLKTVCDWLGSDTGQPFNTLIARIKFSDDDGQITTQEPRIYVAFNHTTRTAQDFDLMGTNIIPYFTSMVWIEEQHKYLAVQPCSNVPFWLLYFDDDTGKVSGILKAWEIKGSSPFRLAYRNKEVYVVSALQSLTSQQPSLSVSSLDPETGESRQDSFISYPYGGITLDTSGGTANNVSVRVSLTPRVAYPVDFKISMDHKRYVIVMRGYYLGRNIEVNLNGTPATLPDFFYVSSNLVIADPVNSEPVRVVRLYCHAMHNGNSVEYCDELPGIIDIFHGAGRREEGYPASSVGFIYGGR